MQEGLITSCACGVELDELERVCRDCGLDEDQAHYEAIDSSQRFERVQAPMRPGSPLARPTPLLPVPRGGSR